MYSFRLTNFNLFLLFSIINGIFFSFPYAIMYGMVADTVEYGEWKTGIRAEGIIYSSVSFVNKLAAGVMGVATGIILDYFGYIPNTKQTVSALFGIDMIAFILPVIFTIFMIIPMIFYNLDNKKFEEIINELNKRK